MTRIIMGRMETSTKHSLEWREARGVSYLQTVEARGPYIPYLFMLGMEKLTYLILDSVKERKWRGLRAGQKGSGISHMIFLDDLVIFAEASTNQIDVILKCLQEFGDSSGDKVSQDKTYICFSPNVTHQVRGDICSRCKFIQVEELGRYLGADISFLQKRKDEFKKIVERVRKRLSGWQEANLSLSGRMTLVKSVTSSMILYPIQHGRIPLDIIDELKKDQRQFIWSWTTEKRRRHAVAWHTLCKPKLEGGMGIKDLKLMNDAFHLKLLEKLRNEPMALWVYVGKYGQDNTPEGYLEAKPNDSPL